MGIPPRRKPGLVFVARFFAALVGLYYLVTLDAVNNRVIVPFTEGIVHATSVILRAANEPNDITGTVIRTSPRFALDVRNGCNGVEAVILVAAAVIAFPATLRSRLACLLVVTVAIQLLNLVRVASLVWLGEHHRALFDVVHVAVWQTIVILAALSMFVVWSVKFAEKPVPAAR